MVSVRQTDTNVTVQATTEADGRFRFPYLKIGPYELRARLQGFKDNARTLVLSAGSAFDISITLEVAGIDAAVTVVADSQLLETARSQIAGTVPQAEVQSLPMNGRNFLDLALLVPGVSPTEHEQHAALCRNLRGSGTGALDRQSAQPLQQLHRRRRVGQRRCRGAERDHLRRRRHRAVSSCDGRRPGRARPRTRRLCQRRHEERHQRAARIALRLLSRRCLQRQERPDRHDAADGPAAVRPQSRRTGAAGPHVLLHQYRAQGARSDRRRQHHPRERLDDQCRDWRRSVTRDCP